MLQQKVAKIFGGSKTNVYLCTRNSEITLSRVLFFFAENDGIVNNELERYGAGELLENGTVQKDIETCIGILEEYVDDPYTE